MFESLSVQPTLSVTTQKAFSVSEINTIIADVLTANLPGFLWVEGEISNLSVATSGHRYFSLKDSGSTISCALFRGSANRIAREILHGLKNGDKVVIKANLSVYKPRGSYQLIISDIEPAGFGALAKQFTELKNKLEQAGLTATQRKRSIPTWARGVGVITSESGAAIRDVLTTLQRRAPFIPVFVYPTLVQGSTAPKQIISAIEQANNNDAIDTILLVRGGGSLEDLMAFNDEDVAMAVVNSRLPIVTGVGHETDFTIVDFVSDYRAPTPTAAAEIVSPDCVALLSALQKQQLRLQRAGRMLCEQHRRQLTTLEKRLAVQHPMRQLQQQNQRVDELAQRLQRGVNQRLHQQQQRLQHYHRQLGANSPIQTLKHAQSQIDRLQNRLQSAIQQCLFDEKQRLEAAQRGVAAFPTRLQAYQQQLKGLDARLTLLSPLGVLQRGYAVVFDKQGRVLQSVTHVQRGGNLTIRLADGTISAVVDKS